MATQTRMGEIHNHLTWLATRGSWEHIDTYLMEFDLDAAADDELATLVLTAFPLRDNLLSWYMIEERINKILADRGSDILNDGNTGEWLPIADAPRDGTEIECRYEDANDQEADDLVYWQIEGRCCILGSRAGSFPPGWTSIDAGNLPVDEPMFWRHVK